MSNWLKSFWPKWHLSILTIVKVKCFTLYQSVPLAKARKWWRVGNCFSLSVMQWCLLRQDEKMNKNQRLCSVYADFIWEIRIFIHNTQEWCSCIKMQKWSPRMRCINMQSQNSKFYEWICSKQNLQNAKDENVFYIYWTLASS